VDGDGREEIIIGTYNPSATPSNGNLLIYALDGTLKASIPVPGGLKHIPALADVEGRGGIDVIYRSLLGQVYVQNFGSTSTNLVSWSTHRGNMRRDGNYGRSLYPPGTPIITQKAGGFRRASFGWTNATAAQAYRIFRAGQPAGPFTQIASVTGTTTNFTDFKLTPGWQYTYEVHAVYATNSVPSVPFAILSFLNSNLVVNAGFEENDNGHWDKWSSSVDMTNMVVTTNAAFQGQRSMQIVLRNQTSANSIGQFNQYGIPDSTIYVTPGNFYSYGGYFRSGGISQPSEHWLTWSSSKTGYNTNNRPLLPFPYYFTPHFVAGTAATDWQYVNRTFQLPAGFPNVEMAHSFSMNTPGNGSIFLDNLFFRPIPSPTATNWTTLIPFRSSWRYYTATPPSNWAAANFSDSAWTLANAKFGAGSGPTNIVTQLPQQRSAYYFRKQFSVSSSDIEELLLACTCTDDSGSALYPLRFFINGTEINATIDTVTAQGNETRYYDLTPFAGLIQEGTNTVAVLLRNYWSTWDDVAFDISLKAVIYQPPTARLDLRIAAGLPSISITAPVGTIWQIQSCDSLVSPVWQPMQLITNLTPAALVVVDVGQNARVAPANASSRYYRLVPY